MNSDLSHICKEKDSTFPFENKQLPFPEDESLSFDMKM